MTLVQNNIPLPSHIYGYVRSRFLNNWNPDHVDVNIPCVIFGVESIPDHALGFHILMENGALYSQLPINALGHSDLTAPTYAVQDLQAWDCFGLNLSAVCYPYLKDKEVRVKLGSGRIAAGHYICTIDFFSNGYSDHPEQHKHLHFIRLLDGNFALQPNNRVQVIDLSFTTTLFKWDTPPLIETNKLEWFCEVADGQSNSPNNVQQPDQPALSPRVHGPYME